MLVAHELAERYSGLCAQRSTAQHKHSTSTTWQAGLQSCIGLRTYISIFYIVSTPSTVVTHVLGGAANTMEASSDEEVQETAMQVLRNIYGDKVREPTACAVTRWGGDPYSRGMGTPHLVIPTDTGLNASSQVYSTE